jgi:alpha-tubulin suppressor-like RCC1 family protein
VGLPDEYVSIATPVPGVVGAVDVTVGGGPFQSNDICILTAGGAVLCWGANNGTTTQPTNGPMAPQGISTALKVSNGDGFTCALLPAGTVRCWGANDQQQLHNGSTTSSGVPVDVVGLPVATDIAAGSNWACASLASGPVQCWGFNLVGVFGNSQPAGRTLLTTAFTPVVSNVSQAVKLFAGYAHVCALLADYTAMCWGSDLYGNLGDNVMTALQQPVVVQQLADIKTMSAGGRHTCAVRNDGTVLCWGRNDAGQLGDGSTTSSALPIAVPGIGKAVAVAADLSAEAGSSSCAVLFDGTVKCWGRNNFGELGNGTFMDSLVPVTVLGR